MRRKLEYREDTRPSRQSWIVPGGGKRSIVRSERPKFNSTDEENLSVKCDTAEMTGSFLHLHLALDASNLDLEALEAHYTVMDRGLGGEEAFDEDGIKTDGSCGELNMIGFQTHASWTRILLQKATLLVMHMEQVTSHMTVGREWIENLKNMLI